MTVKRKSGERRPASSAATRSAASSSLRTKDELDLLAPPLLEGRDDLPDRLVLFGGLPLLPPHHGVGGLRAERRNAESHGENKCPHAHGVASLIKINGWD